MIPGIGTVLATGLLTTLVSGQIYSDIDKCDKTVRDPASISTATSYTEALYGSEITLRCTVCKYKHHMVQVSWSLKGANLVQSSRLHTYQKHPDMYILVVRQAKLLDMGDYSCTMSNMEGKVIDSKTITVDQIPPPPSFIPEQDRVNSSSQLLTWTGKSGLPIIQFLLDFRLSPVSGMGEDWVSLVIPYQTSPQSYLMRGLSPGTRYQSRIRTKTRNGISHYSTLLEFSTYSPWTTIPTTTRPNTVFSLPRTGADKHRDRVETSRAKELSSFISGVGMLYSNLSLVVAIIMLYKLYLPCVAID